MAKSKFLPVYLDKGQVQYLLDDSACTRFVFQQVNPDDDKSKKEFVLDCYGLKSDGSIINITPITLSVDESAKEIEGPKKIIFGNLPISSSLLKGVFGENDQINFLPRIFGNYVGYTIPDKTLADIELNPSPPA